MEGTLSSLSPCAVLYMLRYEKIKLVHMVVMGDSYKNVLVILIVSRTRYRLEVCLFDLENSLAVSVSLLWFM